MTSSGTYNYSLSVGESVLAAFERIQIRAPTLRQEHFLTARRETNLLLATWANLQVNLWKVESLSLTMVDGTASYDVPGRVVMILDAYLSIDNGETTQTDRYLVPMSRTQYASLATKSTPGPPTTYWFNRLIAPVVNVWPVPDADDTWVLNYYACVQMQDAALTSGQTPDLPYLWLDAFVAGLSHRLARTYAPTLEGAREKDAKMAWDIAAGQNTEYANVTISPNLSRYRV